MSKEDGGPAFPQAFAMSPPPSQGMTLRDYMAAKAMQGLAQFLVVQPEPWSRPANEMEVAEQAYALADAMLEARG